jgi:heptosyltransferase II
VDTDCIGSVLIRGTNWVGDALMTTPAVAAIRRSFPAARISLLVVPWVMDIFVHNPHVDEVIPYLRESRHKGFRGKMALIRDLKERRFDLAILLQNAFEAALLVWSARIPLRAGYNTDARGILLTHGVVMRPEYKRIHQTYYYLTMLRGLGLEAPDSDMFLNIPDELVTHLQEYLKGSGKAERPLIVLAPGATYGSAKMWPGERYAHLAKKVVKQYNAYLVILGSAAEKAVGDLIVESTGNGAALNLCGTTSLLEASAWINQSSLFISNDSGLMHVAAALARPQLAIFGPTDRVTTGPRNPRATIVHHETSCAPCLKVQCPTDHSCMTHITVDQVFQSACRTLETWAL